MHNGGFVLFRNLALRCDATPVAEECMPDCDMFDVLVFAADVADCCFQAAREAIFRRFELNPCVLELVTAFVVLICVSTCASTTERTHQRLPVIINDEVADVDLIFGQ